LKSQNAPNNSPRPLAGEGLGEREVMLKIELRATKEGTPGQGELIIQGWKQDASALELAVQRNQDDYYLGEGKHWHASKRWNPLPDVREEDGKLIARVGPWLVDPLSVDTRMSYMLYLQNADGSDKGVLRMVGELLSSGAGATVTPPLAPIKNEPKPEPEPVAPEQSVIEAEPLAPVEPTPPPAPPKPELTQPKSKQKSRWLLRVLLLLIILLIAGLAAWWLLRSFAQNPAQNTASAEAGVCSAQILTENNDDLALIQNCLKTSPSSDEVLVLINAAKEARRCNLVQRLYAHKAQSGDVAIALAYAREYDPASFKAGSCIESADAETAAYWYELALEQKPDNPAARERLEALKP